MAFSPDQGLLRSSIAARAENAVNNLPFSRLHSSVLKQNTINAKMQQLSLNSHQGKMPAVRSIGQGFGPRPAEFLCQQPPPAYVNRGSVANNVTPNVTPVAFLNPYQGQLLHSMCISGTNPILALKGGRICEFNGKFVDTINSSLLKINPDLPDAEKLMQWYITEGKLAVCTSLSQEISSMEKMYFRKTVAQIKDENMGRSDQPDWVTVEATISHINTEKFSYPACTREVNGKRCNRKLKVMEETFGDEARVKVSIMKAERLDHTSNKSHVFYLGAFDGLWADGRGSAPGANGVATAVNVGFTNSDAGRQAKVSGGMPNAAPSAARYACSTCGSTGHNVQNCPAAMDIQLPPTGWDFTPSSYGSSASNARRCCKCNQPGHWARDCPWQATSYGSSASKAQLCCKCNQPGHWARDCPVQAPRMALQLETATAALVSASDVISLGTVLVTAQPPTPLQVLRLVPLQRQAAPHQEDAYVGRRVSQCRPPVKELSDGGEGGEEDIQLQVTEAIKELDDERIQI
ncbi:replication protein A 70 kDa DNA-binding subunit C-like [Aegilops tauschii subsp. strangulata]|uniref:Replication factor A protein 1 n=1 Tax=Aegilops tauschii TaxID=37682 RepID=M8C3P0_AEGTA